MAGGGLAVVLHAVEDAFDHVPPLVRLPVAIPWGRTVPLGRRGRRPGGIPLVVLLQFFLSNFCTIFPQYGLPVSSRNCTI